MKQSLEDILRGLRVHPVAQPSEQFIKNARIRVLNLTGNTEDKVIVTPKRRFFLFPFRFAAIGVAAGLTLGTTVVYAAQSSLPGSMLYPVKVASETVAFGLAPTSVMKTTVAGAVIDRRANEIIQLRTYATSDEVSHAVNDYQKTVDDMRTRKGLIKSDIEEHIREHEDLFDSEKGGSPSGERSHSDDRTKRPQEQEGQHESSGTIAPTPTIAITPSADNREGSRPNASEVLGAHEGENKHQDEGHNDN